MGKTNCKQYTDTKQETPHFLDRSGINTTCSDDGSLLDFYTNISEEPHTPH